MKHRFLLCTALIITSNLFSGEVNIASFYLIHGYPIESINGKGFGNSTSNHISNISSSNPASITDYNKISFGISYQFESDVNPAWGVSINHKRDKKNVPQSVGLVVPIDMFRIGFGFSQRYNSYTNFGQMQIATIDNPAGTGEYFYPVQTSMIKSYSGLLTYSFENIVNDKALSFGIQCNYNQLNLEEKFYGYNAIVAANDIGWTFGMAYHDKRI